MGWLGRGTRHWSARITAASLALAGACWIGAARAEAPASDWSSYFGNDFGWSYSSLDQINRDNVKKLGPVWAFSTGEKGLSATPLVIDGTMYLVAPRNQVFALDAATGRLIWRYAPIVNSTMPSGTTTGLAAGFGLIFLGTVDDHIVALDIKTGREVWNVEIEDPRRCNCATSFSLLLAKDKVVIGTRGDVAHRGFIDAYEAKTGKHAWRFWTVAGPGDPGHDTWPGDTWKYGGGSTWHAGTYDPDLNLVYWGVGNPQPMLYSADRKGNNLYTDSLVAIDADTGKLRWYFQETPNDSLDYDSAPEPVLIDLPKDGKTQKLVVHANKSGYTYVLDRTNGKLVSAWPHADVITWNKGLDAEGKPINQVQNELGVEKLICPSLYGSRAANHSTYSPKTGWWYNTSFEVCGLTKGIKPPAVKEGDLVMGGLVSVVRAKDAAPHIAAFDPVTGKKQWVFETRTVNASSLLSTGGDLIFGGDPFGEAWALDARTGKKLWGFNTGAGISSAPVSYSVGGRQYVAIGSGMMSAPGGLVGQLWPELKAQIPPAASTLFVFALPDSDKATANAH